MPEFKSKKGKPVAVGTSVTRTAEHIHTMEIIATCGESTHSHTLTFGADDGKRPDISEDELHKHIEAIIETGHEKAIEEAVFKESVRLGIKKWQGKQLS